MRKQQPTAPPPPLTRTEALVALSILAVGILVFLLVPPALRFAADVLYATIAWAGNLLGSIGTALASAVGLG